MALTAEEERARVYREQCDKRKEFQEFLATKRKGNDYARRLLCEKTKPLLRGERGETSNA
jgi:hypothetical protein